MQTTAVVLEQPESLSLRRLDLSQPGEADVLVAIEWSGISTGTERLLWSGQMPPFPGMGYPLVPGYESVGRVLRAGAASGRTEGERVFVPGANCFSGVRGLFGGAASHLVVPGARVVPVAADLGDRATLLALAATAQHALASGSRPGAPPPGPPDLIVGHGVLGRLLARLAVLAGGAPVVWERNPQRTAGATGYQVLDPEADPGKSYARICDVSGDSRLLDQLIGRLAPGGEIVLAGFYSEPLSFAFAPAFMREIRLQVAAEWQRPDLDAVTALAADGRLSLDGLITHQQPADRADVAYRTAFNDPACLKMVLDWRSI